MRLRHPPPTTMGCGISRINLMEEGMACGLKRRIVESRSKNDLLANPDPSTASTKFLLKEDNSHGYGDIPDSRHHVRKNSSDDNVVVVMKEPPVKQQIRENESAEREKGDRLSSCDQSPMKKKLGEHKERGTEKEKYETDDEYEEDDDDGRRISNFDDNWIGSPSFREYCVDSESEDGAVNHGDRRSGENTENKTRGMDNVECMGEVCVLPGPKTLEKKGSRGRKFIKVFPMHRPKHFWNVTTCYSRNNHHVPSEKLPEKEV